MAEMEIQLKDVERLQLGPKDILVFTLDQDKFGYRHAFEEASQVLEHLAERMGLGGRVLIVLDTMALSVVEQPSTEPETQHK